MAAENTVLVAMSGGVDSSVTALMLKEAGYKVKGAILRMHDANMSSEDIANGKLPQSIWYAREAARRLRIDFSIIDVRKEFEEEVVRYFVSAYQKGQTPNPCVYCNQHMKFPQMFKAAKQLECEKVATGHYAIIEHNEESGRYTIRRSRDLAKDQSYMLYRLSQEDLSRILTPLGNYEKSEIRQMAENANLKNAKAPDSQDICFIPDKDYGSFVESVLMKENRPDSNGNIEGLTGGDFIDMQGNVLGRHKGLIHYTTGQRRGLGLALPESLYVREKNIENNQVVLCRDEELYTDTVRATMVNYVSVPELPGGSMKISAKVRYSTKETPGTAYVLPGGDLEVRFDTPVRAATPGQSMVLYDGDLLIAGGIII